MPEVPAELAARAGLLRELSREGGPLSPDAPGATVRNPEWFRQVPGGDFVPRPGRRELHRRLLAQFYEEHGRGDTGRQAVVLAGPPGAGKGVVRSQVLEEAGQRFTVVDPDEFKVLLVRAAVEDGSIEAMMPAEAVGRGVRLAPMELAALVHEESPYLARRVRQAALKRGENVVVGGVMADEVKAVRLASQLAGAGYDIQVVDVEVPAEVSRYRIAQRWVEQTYSSELGGRWVPSEFRELVFDTQDVAGSRCDRAARAVAEQVPEVSRYRRFFTTVEEARQAVATPRLTDDLRRDDRGSQLCAPAPSPASTGSSVRSAVQASYPRAATEAVRQPVRAAQQRTSSRPGRGRESGPHGIGR
ncbi:zeta toxin family protein [Actinomyces wuliandei]|uniref:zeta toxin family protein n=1 Tax=Actinomyces wuliandei TaxID=2057743 RepID=UPI0011191551|nr:zeta toxin family protein [Actinomyces wuliandei]